jgi:apolipoprotein N-acyltransferase
MSEYFPKIFFLLFFVAMVEKLATKKDTRLLTIPTFFFWEFLRVGILLCVDWDVLELN